MIKLNFEESLSNLSLLNSTVTETTALINEQFKDNQGTVSVKPKKQ